ncbi:MAG: molybdopterin-containing oxidoreductase family protein [Coriobacteriales bacterium]|jgi:anaerobic selenocysteine-containing dehydrogenase
MTEWRTTTPDGETITRTCAWSPPGCHPVGCGLKVHVKDGKLLKVEGDPEHPITRGALCPRCLALKEYVYNPDRIIYPMKRAREDRGKNKWERCTWEEALDIIEKNAKEITAKYGAESICVFGGTGREANNYYGMWANTIFGSPNSVYAQSGWSCYGPRCATTAFMLGGGYPEVDYAQKFSDRYDHEGWVAPEVILLWGKEPLKSNPDGMWGHSIIDMMREFGTKLIVVDPRVTWLGTRAEEVLQVRPGTDTALAMAFLNVLISENLYDADFVDKWTYGFDQLAESVKDMTPAKASEICGVPEDQIYRAARMYGKAKPSSVGWGLAVDQNPNGVQLGQCLIALMCITGYLDAPGGTSLGRVSAQPGFFESDAGNMTDEEGKQSEEATATQMGSAFDIAVKNGIMSQEMWDKRIGADKHPAVTTIVWTADPDDFIETLETGDPYEIHMAMFSSSNPCGGAISAEPQRWYEALRKLDFNFATETFMNPTVMACADVFLPLSSTIEHNAMVITHYGLNTSFFGAENKCLQVGECKSDVEMMIAVGKRMHPEFWGRFETEDDYNRFNGLSGGISWEQLRDNVTITTEEPYYKYKTGDLRPDHQPGFATKTGRIELYNFAFEFFGDKPLPYYSAPPFGPESTPEKMKDYPFILTTGARTYVSFHSEHRQVPSLRQIVPEPLLDINTEDAKRLGIKNGEWVWIESPYGKVRQKANVTPTIKEGVVHAMHGWWYPEQDAEEPNLFGNWKSNINMLMPNGYNGKLGFGDCFKNMICNVYKAEDIDETAYTQDCKCVENFDGSISAEKRKTYAEVRGV